MPAKPKVGVSYSWKEEREGFHRGAVERFCKQLSGAGIKVIRDTDRVKHGDSLSKFMRKLGAGEFLCVFLSNAYLKSPNCMYELLVAWQTSKDDPEAFAKRVKCWVMPGMGKISQLKVRMKYVQHWKRASRSDRKILKNGIGTISGPTVDGHLRMKEFVIHVEAILRHFSDRLSPLPEKDFSAWIKSELIRSPNGGAESSRPSRHSRRRSSRSQSVLEKGTPAGKSSAAKQKDAERSLAEVYANTVKEIEKAINGSAALREFLATATTGLIEHETGRWVLAAAVKGRGFDVCRHVEAIAGALDSFPGQPHEWRTLAEVAGGLVVLAVDRNWVLAQRELASCASAEMPADDEVIGVGGDRSVNLLHLATAALADGRAQLEKVFGKPPLDEQRVPDPAAVLRGIGAQDQEREIKLHLITYVDRVAKVNRNDAQDIERKFIRIREILAAAYRDDHRPYFGTGDAFGKLEGMIRGKLQVRHLLLIHPSGEDPAKLVTDYVRLLRFLGTIFDTVSYRISK